MATLDPNTLIGIIQGKIGELVFVRTKDGKVIVRGRPVRTPGSTTAELKGQRRIAAANAYVQKLKAEPEAYAIYQTAARLNGKRACDLAKADCSHPPVINEIDLSGYTGKAAEPIRIRASDDVEVSGVTVTIRDQGGAVLEQGVAVKGAGTSTWTYTTTTALQEGQAVSIEVSATDRPGHQGNKTQARN